MEFKVGDRVYFNDPDDDISSGPGTIVAVRGEGEDVFYALKMDDEGEVEAFGEELDTLDTP